MTADADPIVAATCDQACVRDLAAKYDALNLGCGDDTRGDWLNVDRVASVNPDVVMDIRETPWPFPSASFNRILASHVIEHLKSPGDVLEECARTLTDGGRLEVRVPVGADALTDPDHEMVWRWDTPRRFCGAQPWDVDAGLEVISRDVELWTHYRGCIRRVHQWLLDRGQALFGNGRWQFGRPATSGEYRITFRRQR